MVESQSLISRTFVIAVFSHVTFVKIKIILLFILHKSHVSR